MKLWRSTLEGLEIVRSRDLASPGGAGALRFPTLEAGRALLDRLASNPLHMEKLRALAGARSDASVIAHRTDAEIIEELAALLKRGSLRAEVSRSALAPPRSPADTKDDATKTERKEGVHEVEFEITDAFGDPASNVAYVLYFPDGSKKEGTLGADGRVMESGVPPGSYRLELKALTNARFGASKILVGEPIKLFAAATGYDEGASGTFEIYDYRGLAGEKLASVDGAVTSTGTLEGEWSPTNDDVKDLAGGKVLFIAKIGKATATSARVPVLVKHELEIEDPKGPIADTTVVLRFVSGYEAPAAVKAGKAFVWARAGDRLAWVNLPDHAGAFMKVEGDDVTAREHYLPEAAENG